MKLLIKSGLRGTGREGRCPYHWQDVAEKGPRLQVLTMAESTMNRHITSCGPGFAVVDEATQGTTHLENDQ
jgi:hypothetical protein